MRSTTGTRWYLMCSNQDKWFSQWRFHLPQLLYTADLIRVRPTAVEVKICNNISVGIINHNTILQQHKWMTLKPQLSHIHLNLFFISESWLCNNLDWLLKSCADTQYETEIYKCNHEQLRSRYVTEKKKLMLENNWLYAYLDRLRTETKRKEKKLNLHYKISDKTFLTLYCRPTYLVPKNSCIFTSWSNFLNVFFSA